ncbi:hypothetical protein PILCRDRAFT_610849 [Piloderma croceum F 1598]|uniref:Ricin B lectin domain-containing protein n=1 Tax=Piloderma croceum (strain F 1598) TaxID=765440 RepID=A0A0C3BKI3_PILCF|nr:hypothetical protein PILCRDRAFT_610849 [Piloderma croceum F 1598]
MTPLATGIYIITNRRHRNVAILPDTNKHSDIVAGIQENGPGKMWNVNRLSNGTYKIQNCDHHSFANIENSTKASQGDGIVGGSRPQQWKIIEMRSKGDYWCVFDDVRSFKSTNKADMNTVFAPLQTRMFVGVCQMAKPIPL